MVYLVGAGPGDPDLLTVRGERLLGCCDALVYDHLVPDELVVTLSSGVEKVYVGKTAGRHTLSQDGINELLVRLAKEGKCVVRLKGGDPFIFGRGSEEAEYLKKHGIPYEIVPGITAGSAAPTYAGIPSTDRRLASYVIYVTGHRAVNKPASDVPWEWLGQARNGTIVIYMGVSELEAIVEKLIAAGMPPDTPSAIIERGTYPTQRTLTAPLSDLHEQAVQEGIRPPAVFVIGEAVSIRQSVEWIENRPLHGIRVMITRPADQARWVYRRLRELGAEVIPRPTIATERLEATEGWALLEEAGEEERWLVFTSENGVRYFLEQAGERLGDLRALARYRIAAVGAGTARALASFGLKADFLPEKATTRRLAEELVDACELSGTLVVRVRGNLGDDRVERILEDAGARVIALHVYLTFTATWPEDAKKKLFDRPPHFIVFTSSSTVKGLAEILSAEEMQKLTDPARIISIGPSTSDTIRSFGMEVEREARVHTIPAIIDELTAYCDEQGSGRKP